MPRIRKKDYEPVRFLWARVDWDWMNRAEFKMYIKGRKTGNCPAGNLQRQNLFRPTHESRCYFIKSEILLTGLYFPVALKPFVP